jgi:hypothetical protein
MMENNGEKIKHLILVGDLFDFSIRNQKGTEKG